MSLERAFARLAIHPRSPCRQCRRRFATAPRQQQSRNPSATASVADALEAHRTPPPPSPAASSSAAAAAASPTSTSGWSMMQEAVQTAAAARRETAARQMARDQQRGWTREGLERQAAVRHWQRGDVYAPHDLTGVEMAKWKKLRRKPRPRYDVVDRLALNPLHLYTNFAVMSEYVTPMGKIKHSNETNLRPVNQRKMAKAIRRAVGTGILMPGTHRHPEILRIDMMSRGGNRW